MCVAAPGKILSINGTTATVAYSGNRVPANLGVVKARGATGCWCTPGWSSRCSAKARPRR